MKTFKNILLIIGGIALALFIILFILGFKVVSTIFLYVLGIIAVISIIGVGIYYIGKMSGKNSN